ncbi:MAG: NACHT domain-containing protein [Methylococcaceae bacterium]|nr:NACHT domain-containing protein [Methylococcaceae bacterium]
MKENISRIGKVKTIFNPDLIVNLNDIFFEEAISFNDGEQIELSNFFSSNHVLIEGGPGQGKSMYLRRLCLNEGAYSSHIPIFIEFRNLKFKKSWRQELFDAIGEFGIVLDDTLLDFLAKSEKILFILDGFDEIPNNARLKTANELETIARIYPNSHGFKSSTPVRTKSSVFLVTTVMP